MSALDTFVKHADLWFEDGNVVLISEQSGFRVHKGLLTRHSEVFRDMFLMPQPPPTEEESFEGCPTARLVDDRAEEVAMILAILYDGGRKFYNEAVPLNRQVVIAALRIGTKYGFNDIREEALRRISICYPKNLKDLQSHGERCSSACPVIWEEEGASSIAILSLARQLGLTDLLPAALYRCCTALRPRRILRSGIQAYPDNAYFVLTPQEVEDCIEIREELHSQNIAIYADLETMTPGPQCPERGAGERSRCMKTVKSFILNSLRLTHLDGHDALSSLDTCIVQFLSGPPKRPICQSCEADMYAIVTETQEEIWTQLYRKCVHVDDESESSESMDEDDQL